MNSLNNLLLLLSSGAFSKRLNYCQQMTLLSFIVLFSFASTGCSTASHKTVDMTQVNKPVDTATEDPSNWFAEAKFGMFIHWGLYSQTGGVWNGEKYYGITEWLMRRAKIDSADYKTIANDFNPVEFNAEEWIAIAKASGVKYIVITAKHHDGFAMFDSAVSNFDIVDATPYKRDPLKALTSAAQEAGIKIGFYYSQTQDWTEKNASGNSWEFDPKEADFKKYIDEKAIPQIEELLTNYGPIDIIWFDTPGNMTIEESKALKAWVKKLQPNCLVSDRVGHDLGDYKGYSDGEIPAVTQTGRPWEAIFTHNDSWGYSTFDNNFKSTSDVLRILIEVASKGGNLMLNVGPDGLGRLPDGSVRTFLEVGKWLDKNSESIYGTSGSPLGAMPWGYVTQRTGKLYLHINQPPQNGQLIVPGLDSEIDKAYLLANGDNLALNKGNAGLYVELPTILPDDRFTVVVLEYTGELKTHSEPAIVVSSQYEAATLLAKDAKVNGQQSIKAYRTMHYFGDWKHDTVVDGLNTTSDVATWTIKVSEPGEYKFVLNYSASTDQDGQEGVMSVAGKDFYFKVLETGNFVDTGGYNRRKPLIFFDHPVAVINFEKVGEYTVTVRPDKVKGQKPLFKLRDIEIVSHK